MRIAIIHGNDGSDVRVGKLCRTLSRQGNDVHFIGWDRRPNESKSIDLGDAGSHIVVRPTNLGRATMFGQLRFAYHIFMCLRKLRPDVVSCVNEDTAIMVLPLKRLLFSRLVCEVFDSLVDRHSQRNLVTKRLLHAIALISRWRSDRIIVTDNTRLRRVRRYSEKCVVIENYPEDPGEDVAGTSVIGPFKIFVGGTLHEGRGLRQILAAVESIEECRIVSAGWIYDDYGNDEFLQHPKVDFLGILRAEDALIEAAKCDAIFAFYDPATVNNIYASPNKVYDAMSVGRPIIINSETNISEWTTKENLGWSCCYDDASGLAKIVAEISQNRERLAEFSPRVRKKFVGGYSWDSIEPKIIKAYTYFE